MPSLSQLPNSNGHDGTSSDTGRYRRSVRVVTVGAGVIGLSCAVALADAGHEVTVVAERIGTETTSAVAAAIWLPYRALPVDRVTDWGAATLAELTRLSEVPESGIVLRDGAELLRAAAPDPWWAPAVPGLRRGELLRPGYLDSYAFTTPVVEMPIYLRWLVERAGRARVRIERRPVEDWPRDCDAVVNAAGLGAARLTGDSTVFPIRGQVVVVEQFGLDRWWVDDTDLTYLVPRSRDVVVGGTDEVGSWKTAADPEVARAILDRAAEIVPEIRRARVVHHRVGLRPGRPEVRLEREDVADGPPVVHCYGHGGAGVTLSWGCAAEVAQLVATVQAASA
jgi:D-amino-acid oxidase